MWKCVIDADIESLLVGRNKSDLLSVQLSQ